MLAVDFKAARAALPSCTPSERTAMVHVLRPVVTKKTKAQAYALYVQASDLDEDVATYDLAEAMYRRAVALDPELAVAVTNLGNLAFKLGRDAEAEDLYRRSISIDPTLHEAHYNLGYVCMESGRTRASIVHFERAIELDDAFADAHFNMAHALEQVGERKSARTHWKRYLELEPTGQLADSAREQIRFNPAVDLHIVQKSVSHELRRRPRDKRKTNPQLRLF